jgi:predicted TIM-barrel fold metal-dependent hydrolase
MLAGVFDRHPNLVLALTEIRADWLPATLERLDERLTTANAPISMTPSEYFRRHCLVVASSIHRAEVHMRREIGLANLAFGADFPHYEGTWPNTVDWIRDAFTGVPEEEVRAILGENAIRWFQLDGDYSLKSRSGSDRARPTSSATKRFSRSCSSTSTRDLRISGQSRP